MYIFKQLLESGFIWWALGLIIFILLILWIAYVLE